MSGAAVSVVLASSSAARAALLRCAGIAFTAAPADIDEDALKAAALARGETPSQLAMLLAEAKARAASLRHASALIIGADQVLECGGAVFSKPADAAAALEQLRALSGRTHRLLSAVCAARDDTILWRHLGEARMVMRALSEAELARYLAAAGTAVTRSVGAYQFEGLGANLFCAVEGGHATILGMPLLPLLGFLRAQGVSFS